MKKITMSVISFLFIICSVTSTVSAADIKTTINQTEAIATAEKFLFAVKEKDYATAKEILIDERPITNEFGYSFEDLINEDPLMNYDLNKNDIQTISNNSYVIPTKVLYESGDTYKIPIVVSFDNGKYIVHLIEDDNTNPLLSTSTIYETPTISTYAAVDTYTFDKLFSSIDGIDKFAVTAGSYRIEGEQTPVKEWAAGAAVACYVKYSIVKATALSQTTYGSTVVHTYGNFTAYISGSKDMSKARIVISRTAQNPEQMRVRGSGSIYKNY